MNEQVEQVEKPIPTKPMMSSKTIRLGTAYITVGALVGFLQIFDLLDAILRAIEADLPPDIAAWGGVLLAIIGAIQVWLRTVTTQPVGSAAVEKETE